VWAVPAVTVWTMAVRKDCRHYSTRSTAAGDTVQRCRLGVAEQAPFACPDDCLFVEPRSLSNAGWERFEAADDGDRWGEGSTRPNADDKPDNPDEPQGP
jgi:hypothetical protein